MIKRILFSVMFIFINLLLYPSINFGINKILVKENGFVFVELENKSTQNYHIKNPNYVFLSIYINNIKRAEYKIKYINKSFFKPNNILLFKTNFKAIGRFKIKAIINEKKLIKETDYNDNISEKEINGE